MPKFRTHISSLPANLDLNDEDGVKNMKYKIHDYSPIITMNALWMGDVFKIEVVVTQSGRSPATFCATINRNDLNIYEEPRALKKLAEDVADKIGEYA